jgi:hypothetical protein
MLNEERHETEPDWRAIPMGCGFNDSDLRDRDWTHLCARNC